MNFIDKNKSILRGELFLIMKNGRIFLILIGVIIFVLVVITIISSFFKKEEDVSQSENEITPREELRKSRRDRQ